MIICPNCGDPLGGIGETCRACCFEPERRDGFTLFAPGLALENDGFHADAHVHLDKMQVGHFWFEQRNALICEFMRRHAPHVVSMLEIGCGTGYVLQSISEAAPDAEAYGAEIHLSGLIRARRRLGARAALFQMDATQIPFRDHFHLVCAFDVIEHIEDDEAALRQMFLACAPGGVALISVPQHMWLWSAADDYGSHKRRYAPAELSGKARAAGFEVLRDTSFVASLIPAMWAKRMLARDTKRYDATNELRIAPWLNALFAVALRVERALIGIGVDLPFGGSRFVVLRKPEKASLPNAPTTQAGA